MDWEGYDEYYNLTGVEKKAMLSLAEAWDSITSQAYMAVPLRSPADVWPDTNHVLFPF